MIPVELVLFMPSQPGGPELFLWSLLLALGLVIGYVLGRWTA